MWAGCSSFRVCFGECLKCDSLRLPVLCFRFSIGGALIPLTLLMSVPCRGPTRPACPGRLLSLSFSPPHSPTRPAIYPPAGPPTPFVPPSSPRLIWLWSQCLGGGSSGLVLYPSSFPSLIDNRGMAIGQGKGEGPFPSSSSTTMGSNQEPFHGS